jgi:hypothetical protein
MDDQTNFPKLLPHRAFAERHGVFTRTIDRWSEDGVLPEPVRIQKRKYWPANVTPRRDGGDDTTTV